MHDITAILTKTFSRSLPGRVSCSVEPQPDAAVISVESHSDVGDRLLKFTGYINYGSRIVFCNQLFLARSIRRRGIAARIMQST